MLRASYKYKGDPIETVELMFGLDFLYNNPDREITITTEGRVQHIPVEDAVCNTCNANVQATDPCANTQSRLYCWPCFQKCIEPYILPDTLIRFWRFRDGQVI